jgi:hypothetical protein
MAAFAAAEAVRLPNTEALGVHWLGRWLQRHHEPGQAKARIEQPPVIRKAHLSQASRRLQATKHSKTDPGEAWPGWAANQTHHKRKRR